MSHRTAKIVEVAKKYAVASSTLWAYATAKGDFGKNTNKCNQFVYDVMKEAGAEPPPQVSHRVFLSRPPLAREWADPDLIILGWKVVDAPQLGDVLAIATEYADATGHVAILVGEKSTVSARADKVILNDWGFREGQKPTIRRHLPFKGGIWQLGEHLDALKRR